MLVFVLSSVSNELEALGRSGISVPKIPQSGVARFVFKIICKHSGRLIKQRNNPGKTAIKQFQRRNQKKFRLRKDSSSCLLDTILGTTTAELYQLAKCWEQGKSVKVVSLIDFHLQVKITLFHYKWLLVVNTSRIFSFSYKSKLDIFSNFCKIMDMNGLK